MAENIIKDFVRKQTSPVTIGVPKSRNAEAEQVKVSSQPLVEPQQQATQEAKRMGRPRTYEKRAKISMYLPEEIKEKADIVIGSNDEDGIAVFLENEMI